MHEVLPVSKKDNYVERVFGLLNSNPTQQDLDELVEAHVRIGYLAAQAENEYERAADMRKYKEASAYLEAKTSGEKVTDKAAEAMAQVNCWEFRTAETEAKVRSRKVANLLESIERAIDAIEFLGRVVSAINAPGGNGVSR